MPLPQAPPPLLLGVGGGPQPLGCPTPPSLLCTQREARAAAHSHTTAQLLRGGQNAMLAGAGRSCCQFPQSLPSLSKFRITAHKHSQVLLAAFPFWSNELKCTLCSHLIPSFHGVAAASLLENPLWAACKGPGAFFPEAGAGPPQGARDGWERSLVSSLDLPKALTWPAFLWECSQSPGL